MTTLPSIHQLRYFLTVAEELNFGRAARRCHITQSTISGAIQELEKSLGVPLLERTPRKVRLTSAGAAVVAQAREILARFEAMAELTRTMQGPLRAPLHLGIIPTVAPFFLPQFLPLLTRSHPDLPLQLTEDLTSRLLEQLQQGQLDCAIIALPYPVKELRTRRLFVDRLYVAAAEGVRLKTRRGGLSSSDLTEHPLLLLQDGHCLKDQALAVCQAVRDKLSVSFRAASLMTLIGIVDNGLGLTFLPEMAIAAFQQCFPKIQYLPLAEPNARREIVLCWRKSSPREADFQRLADLALMAHRAGAAA